MTLAVKDDLASEEVRRLLSSPGVQFVREDRKNPQGATAAGGRP